MKSRLLLLAFSALLVASGLEACQSKQNPLSADDEYGNCSSSDVQAQLSTFALEPISALERASMLRMREEEKLARDVYKALYAKWNSNVFTNIASAEQTHMDAVHSLLLRYSITDPVAVDVPGVFADSTLQALYTALVAQGMKSVSDAYTVGATIEDLDISDLKPVVNNIDNQDIKWVYENLTRGSRNHMRAFNRNLSSLGLSYTPQYISAPEFQSIINSDMENGSCKR